jgi:ADP-ribose pyrophosphatase YjhB (NUDIX family)
VKSESGDGRSALQPLKPSAGSHPQGSGIAERQGVNTRPEVAAVSVAVVRGGRVLLVRRARPPSQGLFAFPGGKVEPGETLEQAARRELVEETGLEARDFRPVETIFIDGASEGHPVDYRLTVFAATYAGGEPAPADDADLAAFHTLADMAAMPLAGSVFTIARELLSSAGNDPG